jgi:hypothetical protein
MSKTLKVQVLITARALIADKKHWTQKAFARDKCGRKVSPVSEEATRFCALGAVMRANKICTGLEYHGLQSCRPPELRIRGIPHKKLSRLEAVSEWAGHAAVLKEFDKLIDEA